ncbi:MAG TPA: RsmB/NOP family class I SAM-dependent RNA methyltransferase, partial [Actinomycetales bacterium]|nr:RsmB/NOP family class I SAM-dependent RNA methyltransferase [Actinomycetales bacterium]
DQHGVEAELGKLAPTALISPRAVPNLIPQVRNATAGVQDEGSQVVALALTNAAPIVAGEQWLDLCAGPGGKSALLGAIAAQNGAHLTAIELHEHRSELVRQATAPLAQAVTVRTQDGREIGEEEPEKYDRVLVDAPCTGMGALRRRPEARWRRTPNDLANLTPLQNQLLDAALRATKAGGIVVYATCSPHLAETVVVVEDALRHHPDFEQLDAREIVVAQAPGEFEPSDFGSGPGAQLWPHAHGTDAMFFAVLRRKG